MQVVDQSRMRDPVDSPGASMSPEEIAGESSIQRRGGIRRFLGKVHDGVIKQISKRSKDARSPDVNGAGARDIELQDTPHGVEQGASPRSVPRLAVPGVHEATERVGPAEDFPAVYEEAMKSFDGVMRRFADVHPYAKIALGVLSSASNIVLTQRDRDEAVLPLLRKLGQVYSFITQDDMLRQISSMNSIIEQLSQQVLECAHFIRDYSETKNFWNILGKNVASETDDTIQRYNDALDALMQNFRDRVTRDTAVHVHRTGEILDLSGMAYAAGAGLDTRQLCLPGTRMDILSQIKEWIQSSPYDVPRVLWLSGSAGTGKSAIAHTIAYWSHQLGCLGSCFCFDRHSEADRRHDKIFSTIARDMADCDPEVRRALSDAVRNATALKNTRDIIQQWQKLFTEPLGKLSNRNVVILIDALDESGGIETRRDLLRILAGKLQNPNISPITALPDNVRFIVTSRPLRDIDAEFDGVPHILRISMDDIPPEVTRRDIHAYVSAELEGLPDFGNTEFAVLAELADGLFEWARLACAFIRATPFGLSSRDSFNAAVSRDPPKRAYLLSTMYHFVLTDIMRTDTYTHGELQQMQLARFRSVMGQILGAAEPLSIDSMNAMRRHFPDEVDHYDVGVVVAHMGVLLSGTTNSYTPIRPLHASFREFLTNPKFSGHFSVDMQKVQRDLCFASLRVMEHGLRFNICDLRSSYLANCEDPELQERVERCISPYLSYSCRFWATHVRTTEFDLELAEEVRRFLHHERLLFWLEVVGLLKAVSSTVPALSLINQWLKCRSGCEDISSTVMDVQRFLHTFGGIIVRSTPHLYVSALPFSPINSAVSAKFCTKFPNTLYLASGRDLNWPTIQSLLKGHTDNVLTLSFSPDMTRIVTGSADKTIRLWDAVTGQPLGEPLRGHTGVVNSISFSPDGTRIISGSSDNNIRLWDVATGKPLGAPLRGHTGRVNSVSFSPDGSRAVSGSSDNTVRLWDTATREPLGVPLQGHTGAVNSVSFKPDGTYIVSGSSDNTVRIWDTVTGRPVGDPLREHTNIVNSVSFSPDGTRIVSGSSDNTVWRWDAVTGRPVGGPMQGHTGAINSLSFSPDGVRIVSGSHDKTIQMWDAVTGRPVGESLQGHTSGVSSVSFSPDGTRIASGSVDNTVRLWHAASWLPCTKQEYSTVSSYPNQIMHQTEGNTTVSTNTWDHRSICFSSSPTHALCNTTELLKGTFDDRGSASILLEADGWMVGPNGQLLFWVPPAFREKIYSPGAASGTQTGMVELDLSRMAHGQLWRNCRDN